MSTGKTRENKKQQFYSSVGCRVRLQLLFLFFIFYFYKFSFGSYPTYPKLILLMSINKLSYKKMKKLLTFFYNFKKNNKCFKDI